MGAPPADKKKGKEHHGQQRYAGKTEAERDGLAIPCRNWYQRNVEGDGVQQADSKDGSYPDQQGTVKEICRPLVL
jgi:hypothetical protein